MSEPTSPESLPSIERARMDVDIVCLGFGPAARLTFMRVQLKMNPA